MMTNWFTELAVYRLRLIQLEQDRLELRFNPNHDEKTGRFTTSPNAAKGIDKSGGSGIIKTENQKRLQKLIDNGDISLDINTEMQNRHYKGTPEYESFLKKGIEKSYFNVPSSELQKFLKKNAASGEVFFDSRGNAKEAFLFKKNAAYDTKLKKNTSYVMAHYSKKRTHLSPYSPKKKE